MHKTGKNEHETHENILLRLKRARGHLETVIQMIEKEESCLEVSRQMYAVSKTPKLPAMLLSLL